MSENKKPIYLALYTGQKAVRNRDRSALNTNFQSRRNRTDMLEEISDFRYWGKNYTM